MPVNKPKNKPPRQYHPRYPWSEWFARDQYTLIRGEHFEGRTSTFVQQIRNRATRDGLRVGIAISMDENTVKILVVERAITSKKSKRKNK